MQDDHTIVIKATQLMHGIYTKQILRNVMTGINNSEKKISHNLGE